MPVAASLPGTQSLVAQAPPLHLPPFAPPHPSASALLDFLLSEDGEFLRTPLLAELADTVDSLGLAALNAASLFSNGLLPKPDDQPDREQLDRVAR